MNDYDVENEANKGNEDFNVSWCMPPLSINLEPAIIHKMPLCYEHTSHVSFRQMFNVKEDLNIESDECFHYKTTKSCKNMFVVICFYEFQWRIRVVKIEDANYSKFEYLRFNTPVL